MTNKFQTGKYMVLFFDVHGTKQESVNVSSFAAATAVGDKGISKPPYASYVVTRILRNTLDNHYPWAKNAP